ncbi:Rv3235 family protein [Agromyces atrinae]|uniref:3-hydroxyacyl-CoA dehydrogenase n=1 Tax=Agromyces atrinae TaxID=592376 RepID=A0A4Q2M5A8_9MICO|nr:Rv3235 family protein [Agromyces atrinae]NYD66637.1 hypothetical protein [Agromyces atrinae]RXZ87304.1 3-hydroxyacyl-CoA dehydrogenase [Agromyces atrinae]
MTRGSSPEARAAVVETDLDRTTLPDPDPLLVNLTRCTMEVLAGARDIEQLARWVSDDAFRHLLKRSILADRARRVKGVAPTRPVLTVGRIMRGAPTDGVVEAVIMVHQRARSRAVAIRLEEFKGRWRAAAINVL